VAKVPNDNGLNIFSNCTLQSLWANLPSTDRITSFKNCKLWIRSTDSLRSYAQLNFVDCEVSVVDLSPQLVSIRHVRVERCHCTPRLLMALGSVEYLRLKRVSLAIDVAAGEVSQSFDKLLIENTTISSELLVSIVGRCREIDLVKCSVDSYSWIAFCRSGCKICIRPLGGSQGSGLPSVFSQIESEIEASLELNRSIDWSITVTVWEADSVSTRVLALT